MQLGGTDMWCWGGAAAVRREQNVTAHQKLNQLQSCGFTFLLPRDRGEATRRAHTHPLTEVTHTGRLHGKIDRRNCIGL